MTTTGNTLAVVDRHVGYTDQGYRIDLVARDDTGCKVRIRVLHSIIPRQSYAVAEVLAADFTWTELATESPSNWYEGIPNRFWVDRSPEELVFGRPDLSKLPPEQHEGGAAIVAALQKVADGLVDRVAAILA
jgi:hypothetical protein